MDPTAKQFPKRNAILNYLRQTKRHPSAEDLHKMIAADRPDISLATVYRNLALFKSEGLILSLGTVNGVERFDGCVTPHSHLICRECGCVADVTPASPPEALCTSEVLALGWQAESAQLIIHGLCPDCRIKQS